MRPPVELQIEADFDGNGCCDFRVSDDRLIFALGQGGIAGGKNPQAQPSGTRHAGADICRACA